MPKLSLVESEAARLLGHMPEAKRRTLQQALVDACEAHWLEMRGGSSTLPHAYLPPAMSGSHARWSRWIAVGLVAMFVSATAAGVCLTYGPQPFGH